MIDDVGKCLVREIHSRMYPGLDEIEYTKLENEGIRFFTCIINACIKSQYFLNI